MLNHLPRYPGSLLFASALNATLAEHLPTDILAKLEGRALRLEAIDLGLCFDYTWRHGRFCALRASGRMPDLCIQAGIRDFYSLLRRKEDPDTLFFNRRLVIEGDIELGLMVKNALDAIDMTLLQPRRLMRGLIQGVYRRHRPASW